MCNRPIALTALVLAFPIGQKIHFLPLFFVPEEGIKRRSERDRVHYADATDGAVIDYEVIRAKISELAEQFHIKEVAVDWNATQRLPRVGLILVNN